MGRPTNVQPGLPGWYASYRKLQDIRLDGFCEPYLGDLAGRPRMGILALNPGEVIPKFQLLSHEGREGHFVSRIREAGSYSAWASEWPYLTDPAWRAFMKETRRPDHHVARMRFVSDWFDEPALGPADRVDFELYPWHSYEFDKAALRLDIGLVKEFIWEPLSELRPEWICAFGKWWTEHLEDLGVEVIAAFGDGSDRDLPDLEGESCSRLVVVGLTPQGSRVLAEKHSGSARPPKRSKARILREFVEAAFNPRV